MKKFYTFFLFCLMTTLSFGQVIWSDDFEAGADAWTTIDGDGDGQNWGLSSALVAASGTNCMVSFSWTNTTGPLTPNNYLISPAIDLTATTSGTILADWKAYGQDQTWANEHYIVVAATGNTQADIDAGTVLYDGIVGANGAYVTETGNISDFAGQVIHLAIVHNNVTDQFALNIDDVSVYTSNSTDLGVTNIITPDNSTGCALSASENVSIEVTNFGGTDATGFTVSYSVNGGAAVVETVTGVVAPAAMYEHTFATPTDMAALGEYSIEASVTIADDAAAGNDVFTKDLRSSDAVITVHVMTDQSGGQGWTITDNSSGEIVAQRGAYQWNLEFFDDVCIYSDGCYSFNYAGAMGDGTYLEVLLDGQQIAGDTNGAGTPASLELFAIGGGCAPNEVAVVGTTFDRYQLLDAGAEITAQIRNFGGDPITELVANYSVDGGSAVTETFTGLNVNSGAFADISFSDLYTVPGAISNVEITIETVNGVVDADLNNNSGDGDIIPVDELLGRSFVIEEGTGTWCIWCPRGDVGLEYITTEYDDAIGIAVHNDDPMDIGSYDADLIQLVNGGGYPFGGVNRTYSTNPRADILDANYQSEKRNVPAGLEAVANFNLDTRVLNVEVTTNVAAIEMNGDYRIAVVLTEDGVTGTGAGWDQANIYSGGGQGPMGGYEDLPNPVPAADMVYDHVARMQMGGFQGEAGSFPATATWDDSPTYTYTGDVNADWDETKMHAVALLLDMSDGSIVNSTSVTFTSTTGAKDLFQNDLARVFPNPFSDVTNIQLSLGQGQDVSLEVFDALGQRVAVRDYGQLSGEMILPFDGSRLDNGMYSLLIRVDDKMIAKKVVLARQ